MALRPPFFEIVPRRSLRRAQRRSHAVERGNALKPLSNLFAANKNIVGFLSEALEFGVELFELSANARKVIIYSVEALFLIIEAFMHALKLIQRQSAQALCLCRTR